MIAKKKGHKFIVLFNVIRINSALFFWHSSYLNYPFFRHSRLRWNGFEGFESRLKKLIWGLRWIRNEDEHRGHTHASPMHFSCYDKELKPFGRNIIAHACRLPQLPRNNFEIYYSAAHTENVFVGFTTTRYFINMKWKWGYYDGK